MVRGLYIASSGMNVQSKRLDTISNDLANANTVGYKKTDTVVTSFPEMLMARISKQDVQPLGNVSLGVRIDSTYTNFSNGSMTKAEGGISTAIQGDGFFSVQTPQGIGYTRDGSFVVNANGELVTSEGYNVLGTNGPIKLANFLEKGGDVVISTDGQVSLNGETVDQLALVSFEDNQQLQKREDNLYTGTAATTPFKGSLMQGFLESSNVNVVSSMVDMISVSRAYEANQKMIQTQDSLLGKAVNDLGK